MTSADDDTLTPTRSEFDPHADARAAEDHRRRYQRHIESGHSVGTCYVCKPGWGGGDE